MDLNVLAAVDDGVLIALRAGVLLLWTYGLFVLIFFVADEGEAA